MSNYIIKETRLTGFPDIITYESSKKIIEQMKKNICKIKIDEEQGTGFFCKIPFPDKYKTLPVLITNNHIINENLLNTKNKEIELFIKGENDIKKLNLDNRIKHTNKNYDITIIEIKEKDNINNYMELDDIIINDIINNNNKNIEYKDETIYIIHYPNNHLSVSYGILNIPEDKKYEIKHTCSSDVGSSGSPILNIETNKIIGIHKTGMRGKNYNKGTFLNYPIKEFLEKYNPNKKILSSDIRNKRNIFPNEINNNVKISNEIKNNGKIPNEIKNNGKMLQNLIRSLYLKKELFSQNYSRHPECFLIKNQIINNLKQWYNIKGIIQFMDNNYALNGITYQNFNSFYPKIDDYLNKYQPNYMVSIKQLEEKEKFTFTKNELIFNINYINNNERLKYIDNFEIIDREFANFLKQKFNKQIDTIPIIYMINQNKFILAIKFKNNYIYEIATPNANGILTVQYLIEINYNNINNSTNHFDKNIFKLITEIGVEKLISFNEPIKSGNNIILKIHSINEGNIIFNFDGKKKNK